MDFSDGFDAQFLVGASQYPTLHTHQTTKINRQYLVAIAMLERTENGLSTKKVDALATNHPTTPSVLTEWDPVPTTGLAMRDWNETLMPWENRVQQKSSVQTLYKHCRYYSPILLQSATLFRTPVQMNQLDLFQSIQSFFLFSTLNDQPCQHVHQLLLFFWCQRLQSI